MALEYEVASEARGCPDVDAFRSSVQRLLGFDPFRPVADRRVAVQIAPKETGFDGWIRWSDAHGRWVGDRRLSSRHQDCAEIALSLAFSVAVQIQLLATLAPAAPEPPPPAPVPAAPPIVVHARDRAPPPPGQLILPPVADLRPEGGARRLKLFLGFGPSLALGLTPGPTGIGRLFVGARIASFSLEIAVDAAWPARQQEIDGSGFTLDRLTAGTAACGHRGPLAACVTATLGLLQVHGFGVDAPGSASGFFSELGARLAARREFGSRYFAAARVDALVMVLPRTVTLNETGIWTTSRLGALVGMDLGARFF